MNRTSTDTDTKQEDLRRRPGRPSKPDSGLVQFTLWIHRDLLARTRDRAWRARMSVGQYVGMVLALGEAEDERRAAEEEVEVRG